MRLRQVANDVLRNDVMLRVNDVALRANICHALVVILFTKVLDFGGLFWFLRKNSRNYFVATLCAPSGLALSTFLNFLRMRLSEVVVAFWKLERLQIRGRMLTIR